MATFVGLWRFLWDKMAKLSPIDFTIGLPTILRVNDGQNKFEVDIWKNVAKIWDFWPKMGAAATFSRGSDWRNSIIFYPILSFFFLIACFFRDESIGDQN